MLHFTLAEWTVTETVHFYSSIFVPFRVTATRKSRHSDFRQSIYSVRTCSCTVGSVDFVKTKRMSTWFYIQFTSTYLGTLQNCSIFKRERSSFSFNRMLILVPPTKNFQGKVILSKALFADDADEILCNISFSALLLYSSEQ